MNDPRKDADIHALSGAYAVDALDDLERARFEQHLDDCADCRAEVTSLQQAAAELSSLSLTSPPAGLRADVLAGIRGVRPLPPEPALPASRRTSKWRSLVIAACLAGVAGVGAVAADQVIGDQPTQVASAADRVLAAPDARSVSARLPGGASARVVHSASLGKAVLLTSGMAKAPEGRTYELWLQDSSGRMVPAGLMAGGDVKVLFKGDATRAKAAGITVEPAGGSDQPTSAPVALFDFAKAT